MYHDRRDAGRRLAEALAGYRSREPIVLALPRGGVPVGFEVARALGCPLDVVVARKLGVPEHAEFGFGAIGPGGIRVIDEAAVHMLGLRPADVEPIVARELAEMDRRLRHYRGDRPAPDLDGRVAIVVDDGLATGASALAACAVARAQGPRRLVLAVPVAAAGAVDRVEPAVDEVICLATPADFHAVGQWYESFEQTTDDEVVRLLEESRR